MKLKLSKRNLIIIACALAVVMVATAIAVPLVVVTQRKLLLLDSLAVPTIQVANVKAEPDYTVTLGWNKIDGAVGYKLEYYYEYSVKSVDSVQEDEINKASVSALTFTFPRIKGKLHFRICACANEEKYDSGFGEWQTYDVAPLTFDKPQSFDIVSTMVNGVRCYKASESTRNVWKPVTYTYMGREKTVNFYELRVADPESGGVLPDETGQIFNKSNLLSYQHFFPEAGTWTIFIRAVNYGEVNGTIVESFGKEFPELETLYDVADEWTVIEVTVAE